MKLPIEDKCAIMYIKDACDNVGVWSPNTELAEYIIKAKPNWDTLLGSCNGNIEVLDNGKWFLTDFCDFQYGELNENCKPHKSYMRLLEKHGLLERVLLSSRKGMYTLQEKEKEKEKDKEKEKREYAPAVTLTEREYKQLVEDYGEEVAVLAIDKLSVYKMSSGKKYKSDYHALLNWVVEKVGGKDRDMLKAEQKMKREQAAERKKRVEEIKETRTPPPPEFTELVNKIGKVE